MILLPFENLTYRSPLLPEEIREVLRQSVEDGPAGSELRLFKKKTDKPYRGVVNEKGFDILRQINYRNSFQPQIKGQIIPQSPVSLVEVKMRLHPFVLVFMAVWCGILFMSSLGMLARAFSSPVASMASFIPVLMLLFGYGLTLFGFKKESRKSIQDLGDILQANKDPFGRRGYY